MMLRATGGSWMRFILTSIVVNVPIAMLVVGGELPMAAGAAGSAFSGIVLRVLWSDQRPADA